MVQSSEKARVITHVCTRRREAEEAAIHLRESGYSARIYPRVVRAENKTAEVFIVVSDAP